MAHRIPARLTPAEGRKFGLTVGIAFGALAGITFWRDHVLLTQIFGGVGAALILLGLLVPGRLTPLYRGWMGFALVLSKITTPIFLGIVFFLVIAPIGLVMRLFGKNPLRHRPVNDSYWAPRTTARGTMANQF